MEQGNQNQMQEPKHKLLLFLIRIVSLIVAFLTFNFAINLYYVYVHGLYQEDAIITGHSTAMISFDKHSSVTVEWNKEKKTVKTTVLRTVHTNAYAEIPGDLGEEGKHVIISAARKPFLSGELSTLFHQEWYLDESKNVIQTNLMGCTIAGCVILWILYFIRRKLDPRRSIPYVIKYVYYRRY